MACRKKVATTHSTLMMKYRKTACEEEGEFKSSHHKLLSCQFWCLDYQWAKVDNMSVQSTWTDILTETNDPERSKMSHESLLKVIPIQFHYILSTRYH